MDDAKNEQTLLATPCVTYNEMMLVDSALKDMWWLLRDSSGVFYQAL